MEMALAIAAGAAALLGLGALVVKHSNKLQASLKQRLEEILPAFLDKLGGEVVDVVFDEAEDALTKVLDQAAELAKDGKLDAADRKELVALLKDETVGEFKRQVARLKK